MIRNINKDIFKLLYRKELGDFKQSGTLSHFHMAFSRDPPEEQRINVEGDQPEEDRVEGDGVKEGDQPEEEGESSASFFPRRRYVQDCMRADGVASALCRLIAECGAVVYVCGDAKNMAKDVLACWTELLQKHRGG